MRKCTETRHILVTNRVSRVQDERHIMLKKHGKNHLQLQMQKKKTKVDKTLQGKRI